MKFDFVLITVSHTTVITPSVAGAIERLLEHFAQHSLPICSLTQEDLSFEYENKLPENSFAFIAGNPTSKYISALCHALRSRGNAAVIVVDALEGFDAMKETMLQLHEQLYQMVTADGTCSTTRHMQEYPPYVYAFSKVDLTTTTAVLLNKGEEALVILRGKPPFKGSMAFPGGFINPFLDSSLAECAAREIGEEVGIEVDPDDLIILSTNRERFDTRHHVENTGVVYWVPPHLDEKVRSSIQAKDDADGYNILPVSELKKIRLAFDHNNVLDEALATTPSWHEK